MKRVLVTGAAGQIGSELVPALRARYGADQVVATDVRELPAPLREGGPHETLDCTDAARVAAVARSHGVDAVYHLAAILSAAAEVDPRRAYDVNMGGLAAVLEAARALGCAVFMPSSVAVFGPATPRDGTPQDTIQRPTTMYGLTKVAGELLCDYYHRRYGVDTRGIRFPGIVSHVTEPGGGTTDYAVEMFLHAVEHGRYACFLDADTCLDMLYMPDAVRAAIELMEADPGGLQHRNAFNVTAMQVTPRELAAAIGRRVPGFQVDYRIDPLRQAIADSWPDRMDDSAARAEWGWRPEYDLDAMTADMLDHLAAKAGAPPGTDGAA